MATTTIDALKQLDPKVQLQRLEHLAHRTRRYAQLVSRILDREMARGSLEGTERVERRQSLTGH